MCHATIPDNTDIIYIIQCSQQHFVLNTNIILTFQIRNQAMSEVESSQLRNQEVEAEAQGCQLLSCLMLKDSFHIEHCAGIPHLDQISLSQLQLSNPTKYSHHLQPTDSLLIPKSQLTLANVMANLIPLPWPSLSHRLANFFNFNSTLALGSSLQTVLCFRLSVSRCLARQ